MYKTIIISLVAALPLSQGFAAIDTDLKQCSTIEDNQQRLTCFDQWISTNQTQPVEASQAKVIKQDNIVNSTPIVNSPVAAHVAPATIVATSQVVTSQTDAEIKDNFGIEHKRTAAEEEVQVIELTIAKAKKTLHGKWTIDFENNQRWQTITTDRIKFKPGQKVEIKRGALTSFNLSIIGVNKSIKVKRLR